MSQSIEPKIFTLKKAESLSLAGEHAVNLDHRSNIEL